MNRLSSLISSSLAILTILTPQSILADPGAIMGSGNIYIGDSTSVKSSKFQALNHVGLEMIRIGIHPLQYWDRKTPSKPTPKSLDDLVIQAHQKGIKPILTFAHDGKKAPIGNYQHWYNTGVAFAERFRPNSPWLVSQGIRNWGIEIYAAINEPGGTGFPITGNQSYYKLLEGLADGVHKVNPKLKVIPGGFRSRGDAFDTYLKAIAPLFNQGKLDGIDLHRYLNQNQVNNRFNWSAQSVFEKAKEAAGIKADINYYSTEFNSQGLAMSEDEAGKLFLTLLWDQLGVIKNSGQGATKLSMAWTMFDLSSKNKAYGMADSLNPWRSATRAEVMKLAIGLSKNMKFIHRDPKKRGLYILKNEKKKLYVWQNLEKWTNTPGTNRKLTHIPVSATKLKVYGWDGLRKTYPLSQQTSYTITNLSPQETYMFLVE